MQRPSFVQKTLVLSKTVLVMEVLLEVVARTRLVQELHFLLVLVPVHTVVVQVVPGTVA